MSRMVLIDKNVLKLKLIGQLGAVSLGDGIEDPDKVAVVWRPMVLRDYYLAVSLLSQLSNPVRGMYLSS